MDGRTRSGMPCGLTLRASRRNLPDDRVGYHLDEGRRSYYVSVAPLPAPPLTPLGNLATRSLELLREIVEMSKEV